MAAFSQKKPLNCVYQIRSDSNIGCQMYCWASVVLTCALMNVLDWHLPACQQISFAMQLVLPAPAATLKISHIRHAMELI